MSKSKNENQTVTLYGQNPASQRKVIRFVHKKVLHANGPGCFGADVIPPIIVGPDFPGLGLILGNVRVTVSALLGVTRTALKSKSQVSKALLW